ncbi:hypothetical protein [Streptomyces niphimycinicus]|uniref:hypothetical protein n=1 Tax=Streptomyces niphimycinicus TaxID=2842201 RepID=UPI00209AEE9B|nr:hypothetical protein [Streptomyces niphimycinicus]
MISDPQRMTRRGGRHRPETDGDEETEEREEAGEAAGAAGEAAGAAGAGAADEAGEAPGVPGVPGVPGDELRGGSGETVIGRRLSAAGS